MGIYSYHRIAEDPLSPGRQGRNPPGRYSAEAAAKGLWGRRERFYIHKILKWPLKYYKHVLTPLPFDEMEKRDNKNVLERIKASLSNLEINGPNTTIGVLPDGTMFNVIDSKKLRPTVICKDKDIVVMTSEVCGANEILPNRDITKDIYTNERELVVVDNDLNIQRIAQ